MQIRPLEIERAWQITPRQLPDPRGVFLEGFRVDDLAEHIGHDLAVKQSNISVSVAGAVRGIHYCDVPPSQAKYVTATSGAFIDFVVDIRVGSPTLGRWDKVLLDTVDRRAVYLSEGIGHALVCLEEGTTVYLCSEVFDPAAERGITPLGPAIALALPAALTPILSDKDEAAPSLAAAADRGLLPDFDACLAFRRSLAT